MWWLPFVMVGKHILDAMQESQREKNEPSNNISNESFEETKYLPITNYKCDSCSSPLEGHEMYCPSCKKILKE